MSSSKNPGVLLGDFVGFKHYKGRKVFVIEI